MYLGLYNVSWIFKYIEKQKSEVTPTLIPFVACHPHMITLKLPSISHIGSSKLLKYTKYGKTPYSFFLPPVPPAKPLIQAIQLMLSIQTNTPHLHKRKSKQLLNCTFSKFLIDKSKRVKASKCSSPKEGKISHEISSPRSIVCKGCFSNSIYFWF